MNSFLKHPRRHAQGRTLGVIGGLGSLAGGDLFNKLIKSRPVLADQGRYHFLFEQHPFKDVLLPLERTASLNSRKFYVFQMCQALQANGADAVLLPCFASQTFRDEVQAELDVPLLDLLAALRQQVESVLEAGSVIGVLASDLVRHAGLFEKYFAERYALIYPDDDEQAAVMQAVYGLEGIRDGHLEGPALEQLHRACLGLQARGADLILPGMTELSLVCQALQRRGVGLVDANQVYADYATGMSDPPPPRPFVLGVVGGVGPAATVDFMAKVVRNTPADKDQDHLRMVVEHNPQIPDRTANLLHQHADPTMALFATCKKLEEEGADAIAIPCNTAHAFVARLQPYLQVPIVNMLSETVAFIAERFGAGKRVGLLATSGTVHSNVYHDAALGAGLSVVVPDADHQELVMAAIYGERGVKAGYVDGVCRGQLLTAVRHLAERGASVLILGCTELPLVLPHDEQFRIPGADTLTVALIDPTDILAKRCVSLAQEEARSTLGKR